MPSFTYVGPGERVYPEDRDVNGAHLGLVKPGDIRIFDDPPADGWWVPEIPPRDEGEGEGESGASETPDPGAEGDAGDPEPHDETPPGPQPAQPAVIPGA